MKELSQVTALFVDHGLFLPLALRFAEKAKRVLYWTPYERGFSKISEAIIGDGFPTIERCKDIWEAKKDVDLFVFPDIEHSGLQLELESQGFPVWGSRAADSIELNRPKFLNLLEELGLDTPEYRIVTGISSLHDWLRSETDKYIKISRWRGDMETFHWRDYALDKGMLDSLTVRFGPAGEHMRFLVFDSIDTPIEIGGDTYCVDGQWPSHCLNGIEWKDKAYLGTVTPFEKMPDQVRTVMEKFGPVLKSYRYRNEFSSEIRVVGEKFFFIDPTCRGGLPSTASQMALWRNFPEIIWSGANGEMLNPEFEDEFSVECALTTKCPKDTWGVVALPPEVEPYCKLASCCMIDDLFCFPPDDSHGDEIGWLVATGKTPKAAIENIKAISERLPDGVCAKVESLADILKEIEVLEEEDIPVTDKPVPEPAIVLDGPS